MKGGLATRDADICVMLRHCRKVISILNPRQLYWHKLYPRSFWFSPTALLALISNPCALISCTVAVVVEMLVIV